MFRCGTLIILLAVMIGCAGVHSGSRSKENQAKSGELQSRLQPLYGEWFGQRGGPFGIELLRVVLSKDNYELQALSGPTKGSAELIINEVDSKGILFTFRPVLSNLPSGRHSILPGLATGLVRVSSKGEQLLLEFPTTSGNLVHGALLSQARIPTKGKEMLQGGADGIVYADWQTRDNSSGEGISRNESRDRLEKVFLQLSNQGDWQCLAQGTLTVSQKAASQFLSENKYFSSQLYLIYAPEGNGTLTYNILTKGYLGLHGHSYDYPVFISKNDATVTFTLHPDDSRGGDPLKPLPLSVFVFGRHFEGQESKCSLSGSPLP